jgi:fumarate reductase subunit D
VAIAKKALVWSLFAAGGTVTAFLFPALIALFLMVSLGYVPGGLSHASVTAFAGSWIGKISLFGVMFFSVWHAAHRMRVLFHDFGVRADRVIATTLYLLATVGTVLAAEYLWNIR